MKLVVNRCFGGFSLSPRAIKRLAELNGRKCCFFTQDINPGQWAEMTNEQKEAYNKKWGGHSLQQRPDDRADPKLVQVVEELGEAANGRCAKLRVVEIPDGIDWEIDEYDGNETVHEKHRSW